MEEEGIGVDNLRRLSHPIQSCMNNQTKLIERKPMSFMSNINFDAVVSDIFTNDGKRVDPKMARGVYRDDTGELLSVCGPTFKPVQHKEVLEPLFEMLDKDGYSLEVREPDRGSLYDLAGKKGAFIQPIVTDNGAVMRTNVIVGDFIQPTGASSYLEAGPDTMLKKYSILNSHNSKLAATAVTSWERLVCMNGIVTPSFSVRAYGKHTLNFNVEAFKAKIIAAAEAMAGDADTFGKYAKAGLSVRDAEKFLKATFAKLPALPNGDANFSQRLVDDILTRFNKEARTVWGLVQALTEWSTHGEMKAGSDHLLGRLGREERVSKAMRSPLFDALAA